MKKNQNAYLKTLSGQTCFKENLNASRPSEHPPIRGENVKTFRWDHRLQIQNLFGVLFFSSFFSFISLIADGPHHYHPACGHKGSSHLSPVHALQFFLSRCKFSTLTTRQPMVEFYLLTFPRFPLRKKEHKSYFGKNRTHDFRTSRCATYLLDHSGDERLGPQYWTGPSMLNCHVLKGFGIYMIGILGSLSDVVLHVVHPSCNLLVNIKGS